MVGKLPRRSRGDVILPGPYGGRVGGPDAIPSTTAQGIDSGLPSVPVRPPVRPARPLLYSLLCPKFWLRGMVGGWNISKVRSAVGDAIARARHSVECASYEPLASSY
eukprot:6214585-Pleurochrysis_carterae.AAC.3